MPGFKRCTYEGKSLRYEGKVYVMKGRSTL